MDRDGKWNGGGPVLMGGGGGTSGAVVFNGDRVSGGEKWKKGLEMNGADGCAPM